MRRRGLSWPGHAAYNLYAKEVLAALLHGDPASAFTARHDGTAETAAQPARTKGLSRSQARSAA